MKAAVCEDSLADMEFLKKSLAEACAQLNICMQYLDGVKTSRKVRDLLPDVQIAFLTTSRDFMLDAFDLNALHYLIKPISTEKLRECLERFCDRIRIPTQMLEIKSNFRTYTYPLMHIQKVISYKKGVDIYLQGLEFPEHIPVSFARVEEQLDPDYFLRISRGFIVQMSYILCIDKEICRLKDGTEVLISRRSKTIIRKKYNDYLFQK